MALNFLLKRSGTASKRPNPASMALGELDLNYDALTGGVYYKDSAGSVVKVGPAEVGSSAPNSSPAGSAGNSVGEFWYDTSNSVLKIWNGSSWAETVSTSGFLPTTGGSMTGNLYISNCELQIESNGTFASVGTATFSGTTDLNGATSFFFTPTWLENIGPASQVTYDGTTSGLVATEVQAAIDELASGSWLPAATTTTPGIVQLNDTTSSTSTTEALTANQGKELQDQINALSIASNITLAGTIDASTGNLVTVTSEGATAGFTVGDPLPSAASGNDNYFVIVTTPGTMTPPGGSAQECHQGDWWLSDGTAWVFLDVGFNATAATTSTPGVVQLATDAEVQAGLNTDHAVTPSGLQSKVSDSISTTSSTTLASSTAVKAAYDAAVAASLWTETAGELSPATENSVVVIEVPMGIDGIRVSEAALGVSTLVSPGQAIFIDNDHSVVISGADSRVSHVVNSGTALVAGVSSFDENGDPYSYNMQIGDLQVNGDAGSAGYRLTSNGLGSSPTWEANSADLVSYDNTASGLVATDVQTAIDEVDGIADAAQADATQALSDAAAAQATADAAVPNASYTALGDILSGTGAGTYSALPLGTDTEVLTADSTCPGGIKWAPAEGGIPASSFTVKGGLLAGTGSGTYTEVPAGSSGQVLTYMNSKGSCDIFWTDLPGAASPFNPGLVFGCSQGSTTALGEAALQQFAIGDCNTAIGGQALGFMNEGSDNVAIGWCAGSDLTCGSGNVLIGSGAQTPLLDTNCRLAIGFATGQYWITGDSTKAIKPGAGIIDCTGSCGTPGQVLMSNGANAICWGDAGGSASNATPSVTGVVYGYVSTSTKSDGNTGLGFGALSSVVTPVTAQNVAVGTSALGSISAGVSNIALGERAMQFANNVSGNIAVGGLAGMTAGGCSNVFIGCASGIDLALGDANTFLGTGTGSTQTEGSYNVAIGGGINLPNTTLGCQLAIGHETGCWIIGCPDLSIRPGAGIIDCAGSTGTAGQVLMSDGANAICWGNAGGGGGIDPTLLTAKGSIIAASAASTPAELTAGSNGQILYANSACATGLCWGDVTGGPVAKVDVVGTVYGCTICNPSGNNTSLGFCGLGTSLTTGLSNVSVGGYAGFSLSSGNKNVAIGESALFGGRTCAESDNVAVGNSAMSASGGSNNTAIGSCAGTFLGFNNIGGDNNVAIGFNAMSNTTAGCFNVAIGSSAASSALPGCRNVAIGPQVNVDNTTLSCQLAIGFSNGQNWITGNSTKAIRPGAGIIDCAGSCGTAGQVLMSNGANAICWGNAGGGSSATPTVAGVVLGCTPTDICNNLGIGGGIFANLTTGGVCGGANIAIGACAARCGTGVAFCSNVAIGACALWGGTGGGNIAIGMCTLYGLTTGGTGCCNIAIGSEAGRCITNGLGNTAVGHRSMFSNITSSYNTAIGWCTLVQLQSSADYNTVLGAFSGRCVNTGCGNVIVGSTRDNGLYVPVFNVVNESNRVVMGTTAVTNAYVQVAWTVVSDARDKIVEGDVPHGLDFVNQLEPKAFHFKESRESDTPNGPLRYGFLAQDVLALEGGDGVIIDAEDPDKLRYNGEALVPVLVNAIKELSAKNDELEARLRALEIPG